MKKKLFVVSDIHSFYTPLKQSLDEKGFNPDDENHWLIVCGDSFDRGDESIEVLHFLMPLERKVLIKGNHDIMLEECIERGFQHSYDSPNGTARTIKDIGGSDEGYSFLKCCQRTFDKTLAYRDSLVNYFETENYIFVHSWIPYGTAEDEFCKMIPTYRQNWREAINHEWDNAMWVNPFYMLDLDLNQTGKTIVFGHWHCSAGHKRLGNSQSEFGTGAVWEPCYYKNGISIDRCTANTNEVNVLVLEDEFLESK